MTRSQTRRLFRYGLRTLLLLTVTICVLLALGTREARRQKEAVGWVEQMGGTVGYDHDHVVGDWRGLYYTSGHFDQDGGMVATPPPGPEWCRDVIGLDYFSTVIIADLAGTNTHSVSQIGALVHLQALYLNETRVTDLSPLFGLRSLRVVDLRGTDVDEQEVNRLRTTLPACEILR